MTDKITSCEFETDMSHTHIKGSENEKKILCAELQSDGSCSSSLTSSVLNIFSNSRSDMTAKDDNTNFLLEGLVHMYRDGEEGEQENGRQCLLKKVRQRFVNKRGEFNIYHTQGRKHGARYLSDIFTTLVDTRVSYVFIVFILTFCLSWLGFAGVWWVISFIHDDFNQANYGNDTFTPCITGMKNFASSLLFSIETQHTIGYGSRYTTEACPHAIFVMMFQSCVGVIIQCIMAGILFAKTTRPKKRTETLLFSRNAVICRRDGCLSFMFRVGDMRTRSNLVDAHVRAYLIRKYETEEGDVIPLHRFDLDVGYNDGFDRVLMNWPNTIVHKIDENSPLWFIGADDLKNTHFEIIAVMEATIETTGMSVQARTSYIPEEILWGHRFEPVEYFNPDTERYKLDLSKFHITVPEAATPKHSAARQPKSASETNSHSETQM